MPEYRQILSKYGKYAPSVYQGYQADNTLSFQKERAGVADTQWQQSFKQQAQQFAEELGFKKDQAAQLADQWSKQFEEGNRRFNITDEQRAKSQKASDLQTLMGMLSQPSPKGIPIGNWPEFQQLLQQLMDLYR